MENGKKSRNLNRRDRRKEAKARANSTLIDPNEKWVDAEWEQKPRSLNERFDDIFAVGTAVRKASH